MTQRTDDVAAGGTRRFQRGAGEGGIQKSVHGFTGRQYVARRNVRR
jgi:hypothetical protein